MKPLLFQTPVTDKGDRASRALVEIIAEMQRKIDALEARIAVLEGP